MLLNRFQKIYFSPNEGGAGTPATGQAPAAGSGQEPPTPPAAGGTPQGQASGGGKSAEEYERILADLRKENAGHRNENKSLKEFKDAQEAATLSETEKIKKAQAEATAKATQHEADLKTERTERAIEKAARKLNIVDEEAALAFIGKKVEFDETGKPTNVDALLADLVKAKPYLVAQANSGSAGNPARGGDVSASAQIDADFARRRGGGGIRI